MNTPNNIETEASLWVVRMERGLTGEEQDHFIDWISEDPRHGEELSRQSSNWDRLNRLADWRPEHAAKPNPDLLAPSNHKIISWAVNSKAWTYSFVAAAAVVLFFAAAFYFQPNSIEKVEHPVSPSVSYAKIEQRELEDGSLIEINRGSTLAVLYTEKIRQIVLESGEANFKVAKNKNRPFIVSVAGVDVRAVGTVFNIKRSEQGMELIVTEGENKKIQEIG